MGDVMQFRDDPLPERRAMARIKALWNEGHVTFWTHCQEQMIERKLETTDIGNIIRTGRVVKTERPRQRWRYTVEGTIENAWAACVVEINGMLIVVTAIDPKHWRRWNRRTR